MTPFSPIGGKRNAYSFTGKPYDPAARMYYFVARWYDGKMGRFVSKDPWTFAPDDERILQNPNAETIIFILDRDLSMPKQFHRYAYCFNNPVNYIDPWGLCVKKSRWEELLEGRYFGTEWGEESAKWWAERYVETGGWYFFAGGLVASLWTSKTWYWTASALGGAYFTAGWVARTGPWLGTIGIHRAHHGLGPHFELILRVGRHEVFKLFIPGKKRIIFWFIQ